MTEPEQNRYEEMPEAERKDASQREQAVAKLQRERSEEALWECVVAYQNYPFLTASGLLFHYELKRGRNGQVNRELLIDRRTESKSLTWSSVRSAFRKVEGEEVPFVERPKALGDIRGVSYIYPMFFLFGLIEVPEKYREKMTG